MTLSVHDGTWQPKDRSQQLYRSFPFEVPRGTAEIRINLIYTKAAGQALDLGLFDPDGFRGWSGSARANIVVRDGSSTPGYVTGPIQAGTWQVELGLHRIPPGGLPYRLEVHTSPVVTAGGDDAPPPEAAGVGPVRTIPALPGHRWLAGAFDVHSHHSDGTRSVGELVEAATIAGLDFLVVSDFNTISHYPELDALRGDGRPILIGGQTVALDTGHTVVVGQGPWIDLREDPAAWAARARTDGRLLIAGHPVRPDAPWRTQLPFKPDLAEIWAANWDGCDLAPLAWWAAAGAGIAAVGATDQLDPTGWRPVTWVQVEGDDVIAGLAAGATAVSATRDGAVLVRVGDELIAIDANGLQLVDEREQATEVTGSEQHFPAGNGHHYLRDPAGGIVAIAS